MANSSRLAVASTALCSVSTALLELCVAIRVLIAVAVAFGLLSGCGNTLDGGTVASSRSDAEQERSWVYGLPFRGIEALGIEAELDGQPAVSFVFVGFDPGHEVLLRGARIAGLLGGDAPGRGASPNLEENRGRIVIEVPTADRFTVTVPLEDCQRGLEWVVDERSVSGLVVGGGGDAPLRWTSPP